MKTVIQPKDIDTSHHFWDAFNNYETEVSARWIVRFCQQRDSWKPFTHDEIERFYRKGGYRNFQFNHLIWDGFIEKRNDSYHITHRFIARCYETSPEGKNENGQD